MRRLPLAPLVLLVLLENAGPAPRAQAVAMDVVWTERTEPLQVAHGILSLSPDGTLIAHAPRIDGPSQIHLRQTADGEVVRTIDNAATGLFGYINALAFSSDGSEFVSAHGIHSCSQAGCQNRWALLARWGTVDGALLADTTVVAGHVDYSSRGELAVSTDPGAPSLWSAATLRPFRPLWGLTYGATFSPDGLLLALPTHEPNLYLLDTPTGGLARTLVHADECPGASNYCGGWPRVVAFSPDGRLLASAGWGSDLFDRPHLRVWQVNDGALVRTWPAEIENGPGGLVETHVSFTLDGRYLVTAIQQRQNYDLELRVRILDIATGEVVREYRHDAVDLGAFALAPDGRTFVYSFSTSNGEAFVRVARTGLYPVAPPPPPPPPEQPPSAFALSVGPNPFTTVTSLTLEVPAEGPVSVSAFDALGREVAIVHEGVLEAGTHALELDAATLRAGVYVVRATGPSGAAMTCRVTRVR